VKFRGVGLSLTARRAITESGGRRDYAPQGVLRSVKRTLFEEVMIAWMKAIPVQTAFFKSCRSFLAATLALTGNPVHT